MGFHQQGLTANEPLPLAGLPVGIAAEIKTAEHRHQGISLGQRNALTAQELQAGVPIVVPASLPFEGIHTGDIGPPMAVVMHRFHQGPAVAARDIADHAIDVEQHHGSWSDGW